MAPMEPGDPRRGRGALAGAGALARSRAALSPRVLARALIVTQLAAIVLFGVLSVSDFFIWGAGGDERAHFAYIQTIAQQGRLPIVNRDRVSLQVQAITDGTYPLRSPVWPSQVGLRGRSYEAFQPPLYYLTAVPVFDLSSNYLVKVKLLRGYGLLLLLASIALCAALARRVFGRERWLLPFAFALTVYLWPGVLVGGATVSNAALELPLMIATVWALWRAHTARSGRALLAAGALIGLCLLTQVTLVFIVPLLVAVAARLLWRDRSRRMLATAAAALVLPLALLTPWLIFNEIHYHALTANSLAQRVQHSITPKHVNFGFVTSGDVKMVDALLPEDWWFEGRGSVGTAIEWLVIVELIGMAAAGAALALRRRRAVPWLLLAPAPLWFLTMDIATIVARWNLLHPRYGYSALPLLALFGAGTLVVERRGEGAVLAASAATSALLIGLWVWLAATFY